MEVQRGICSLCSESGKVFTSADAEEFLKCLPRVLYENFLTEAEFQKIKDSIKICSICCYKLELTNEIKKNMLNNTANNISEGENKECHFCKSTKCVIKVKDDWKYIVQRTETFLKTTDFPVGICYRCMFYFDTIFHFKIKMLYKFPHLAAKSPRSAQKQNDTPKRKSLSHSPPNSKKRKIFDNCFTYLQPLCNSNYHIDEKFKMDAKMYKKIAFVNLKDMRNMSKETPKVRPVIKIKLKKRAKKVEKEKSRARTPDESLQDSSFISQPYVKLCKSEDVSNNKADSEPDKQRRHSLPMEQTETEKETEDKLDETPKAATTTNLAPKRRVSLYAEPNDTEVDAENIPDTENQINSEDINNIVEKYIKDTTFNDSDKLELLQEIEENVEKDIEENGLEKITDPSAEDESLIKTPEPIEKENDNEINSEKLEEEKEQVSSSVENAESPSLLPQEESLPKTPTKCDSGSESSDSDVSDKSKSKSNQEGDSLSGSERKKKRVTFSDEIND